jgi:uncharacterized membrane protein
MNWHIPLAVVFAVIGAAGFTIAGIRLHQKQVSRTVIVCNFVMAGVCTLLAIGWLFRR